MRREILKLTAAALALAACVAPGRAEPSAAAQSIADKFSQADAPKSTPESPTRPSVEYEMDMLKRARAEAQDAKAPKSDQPAPAPTPAAAKSTPAPATAAAASDTKPAGPTAAPLPTPPPTAAVAPTATPPPVTSQPVATPAAAPPPTPAAPSQSAAKEPTPAAVPPAASPPPKAPTTTAAQSGQTRATVLVVLEPNDVKSTPDPIICLGDTCAVSTGLTTPARIITRAEALALKTTASETDDTCFGKGACAYRGVPIGKDTILQVLSAGAASPPPPGDGFTANLDDTCKLDERDLICSHPLATLHYTAWIVPEDLAEKAGPAALEDAIADGLPFDDEFQSADK